ncbi:MAG TPA: replication-relaxation family protein [Solirubrobacteraceae bacterium]|nr:replication-relaxation family protein [Solirubrobacteraceae bacterium]
MSIIAQVADLRLMSGRQIQAIHFPRGAHVSELSATRTRQRVLLRLIRDDLLSPLQRRVGGIRAGSAGLVVAPGPLAGRLLRSGRRRPLYEPTSRFFDHTLAISQVVVDVSLAVRDGAIESVEYESEPKCWRVWSGISGRRLLRPDLALALGVDGYELRWFCEVDRATESLSTVLGKCRLYVEYYQAGGEQAKHGVFPRVCWVVPDDERAERLKEAIARERQFPGGLFTVATSEQAVQALSTINR